MIPEITILKLLCVYQEWLTHHGSLEPNDLPRELQGVYRCLNSYHESNDSHVDLTVGDLSNLYFSTRPKDREYAVSLFEQIEKSESSGKTVHELIKSITVAKVLRQLSLDAYDCAEGKLGIDKLRQSFVALGVEQDERVDGSFEFVTDDLEVLVHESTTQPGLRWRLATLNRMFGSLRRGDFGFIFARPETGKTTFLASEVTHMAEQANGPVLWLNNEEQGNKVMIRCYQAALGLTLTELYRDLPRHKEQFMEMTHGNIKMYDSGHIHKKTVERMCKQLKPALIVVDQIDKIQGFDDDREDLRLGAIYQWFRELAKEYAPVIAVCQAAGDGEGVKWLTMAHVANAKTAKQAEADFILGIGRIHDVGFDTIRYLHASKNKLVGDPDSNPEMRHGRMECLIHPEVARYGDIG